MRQTHHVSIVGDRVTKTYRTNDRGEAAREWFALDWLNQHAEASPRYRWPPIWSRRQPGSP